MFNTTRTASIHNALSRDSEYPKDTVRKYFYEYRLINKTLNQYKCLNNRIDRILRIYFL